MSETTLTSSGSTSSSSTSSEETGSGANAPAAALIEAPAAQTAEDDDDPGLYSPYADASERILGATLKALQKKSSTNAMSLLLKSSAQGSNEKQFDAPQSGKKATFQKALSAYTQAANGFS